MKLSACRLAAQFHVDTHWPSKTMAVRAAIAGNASPPSSPDNVFGPFTGGRGNSFN